MTICRFFTLTILLTLPYQSFAQTLADYWYFGHKAGIHFEADGPVALTNGQLHTWEGVATISDDDGNLLFYSAGDTAWNRNHQVMPNGTGLLGHSSASQSAIFCPDPASSARYYLFTVDAQAHPNGFRYSIVDLGLDGGMGDIDTNFKNILIETPVCEKLTAVKKCDHSGYWIMVTSYGNNEIHAYSLTAAGLDTANPVVSYSLIQQNSSSGTGIGYMKASHDAQYIVLCNSSNALSNVELFKFNAQTGELHSPIVIPIPSLSAYQPSPYGIEFSPNSLFFYISGDQFIYQYSIEDYNLAAITASKYLVAMNTDSLGTTALQIGPDKKIYSNYWNHLNVIHNPDSQGSACNFEWRGVYLDGRDATLGLPNFIQSAFYNPIQSVEICVEDSVQFHFDDSCANSITWNFGDPGSGSSNISLLNDPVHHFSDTGTFLVRLIVEYPTVTDTFTNNIYVVPPPDPEVVKDTMFMCAPGSLVIDARQFRSTYLWSTGSDSSAIEINNAGWYSVTISNICTTLVDSVLVIEVDSINLSLGPDTTICEGVVYSVLAQLSLGTAFLWWNGDTISLQQFVVNDSTFAPQTLWLQASNACNTASDTVTIAFSPNPDASWFNDSILCDATSPVIIPHSVPGIEYFITYWTDDVAGDTLNPWTITSPGLYYLHAQNTCDTQTVRAFLSPYMVIEAELGEDIVICSGDSVLLNATWPGSTYQWNFGSTDSIVFANASNNYVVTITNGPCTQVEQRQILVTDEACDSLACKFSIPNVFTPNADGVNDVLYILNRCGDFTYNAFIYNRWGQLLWSKNRAVSSFDAGVKIFWDGYVNGISASQGSYFLIVEYTDMAGVAKSQQLSFTLLK